MTRARFALRMLGRIAIVAMAGVFLTVVGVQYARIIAKNVNLANRLAATENDVAVLTAKRAEQDRRIRRLSDPLGTIPEIHDKLHLVGPHEAIIYLHGEPGDGP